MVITNQPRHQGPSGNVPGSTVVGQALAYLADYFPFGWVMPRRTDLTYRYGFQGQEKDPETGWDAFELRMYDSRIARWMMMDITNFITSRYVSMLNDPVKNGDIRGAIPWPMIYGSSHINSFFGKRPAVFATDTKKSENHGGIDIRASSGTSILAAASGVVVKAYSSSTYGQTVLISHGNGLTTLYAHMSEIKVTEGQKVGNGQEIGLVGSTGLSSGPHGHFEVIAASTSVGNLGTVFNPENKIDPLKYEDLQAEIDRRNGLNLLQSIMNQFRGFQRAIIYRTTSATLDIGEPSQVSPNFDYNSND